MPSYAGGAPQFEGPHHPPFAVFQLSVTKPPSGWSLPRTLYLQRVDDARLEPRRHDQGTALGPRGKTRCPLVASRRGEMPNWSPFRVIVIFYGKWRDADGPRHAFHRISTYQRATRGFGPGQMQCLLIGSRARWRLARVRRRRVRGVPAMRDPRARHQTHLSSHSGRVAGAVWSLVKNRPRGFLILRSTASSACLRCRGSHS
jgi:hypothetical protein